MKKILIWLLLATICALAGLTWHVRDLTVEKARLERNQAALLQDVELYQTSSEHWAASAGVLELSKREVERSRDSLARVVNDLGLKLKRVQELTTTSTYTEVQIVTEVRDSIIYKRDTVLIPIPVKAFDWRDPWVTVNGILAADTIDLNIQSRDTIVQVVHRVPHKFLFFRWGCKEIRQEVRSSNPHTKITYTENIRLR